MLADHFEPVLNLRKDHAIERGRPDRQLRFRRGGDGRGLGADHDPLNLDDALEDRVGDALDLHFAEDKRALFG